MTRLAVVALLILAAGCGPQGARIFTDYSSSTFGFSVQLAEDLERAGWGVIDAEDATVRHTFTPPEPRPGKPLLSLYLLVHPFP